MTIRAPLLLAALAAAPALAQTPTALGRIAGTGTTTTTTSDGGRSVQSVTAPNNPWMAAAELSFKPIAGGTGGVQDWLYGSGKIVYDVPFEGRFARGMRLPVMANLADLMPNLGGGSGKDSLDAKLQTLVSSTDGMNAGLFPYWTVGDANPNLSTTIFAIAATKINAFTDSANAEKKRTLVQGRFGGGLEFGFGKRGDGLTPLTLSASLIYSRFSGTAYREIFGESKNHLMLADVTLIAPLAPGVGLLVDGTGARGAKAAWRVGLLFTAGKAASAAAAAGTNTPTPNAAAPTVAIVAGPGFTGSVEVLYAKTGTPGESTCALGAPDAKCTLNSYVDGDVLTVTVKGSAPYTVSGSGCAAAATCQVTVGKEGARITVSNRTP